MYYLCLSNIWPETFAARNPSRNPSIASTLFQLRRRGLIVILLIIILLVTQIRFIIMMAMEVVVTTIIPTMLNSVDQYDGNGSGGDDNIDHNVKYSDPKLSTLSSTSCPMVFTAAKNT